MKHKKTAALIFAVTLGLSALTACTKQPDSNEAASGSAKSSAIASEVEKDCCKEKSDCCEENEKSGCCTDKEKSHDNSAEEKSCCHKESDQSSVPDCCKNDGSSDIPDCCAD